MILHDLFLYGKPGKYHLYIKKGRIQVITNRREDLDQFKNAERLELDGSLVLPGFINSHDHLDFNNFPSAGNKFYSGYREWADDVNKTEEKIFERVLKIPQKLRIRWGMYKNLLNGFTTVVNHGAKLRIPDLPIDIFQNCSSLHSVAFEKKWEKKLKQHAGKKKPVVMHMGEGITDIYRQEIDEVISAKPLSTDLVAVHGVAMTGLQAQSMKGLVWCPSSNFFMLGETAPVKVLKQHTTVVFGTDSTLSAPWNAWEHFRKAMGTGMVTANELMDMLTTAPAGLWMLTDRGMITENAMADILVIPRPSINENLFDAKDGGIQLLMNKGRISMIDTVLSKQLKNKPGADYSRIHVSGQDKWVMGDLPGLMRKIEKYDPAAGFSGLMY